MHVTTRELYGNEKRFLLNFSLLRILRSIEEFHEIENQLSESQGEITTEGSGEEDPRELLPTNCQ
jgi:hypothetical protein